MRLCRDNARKAAISLIVVKGFLLLQKIHFYGHQVLIVTHDLTNNTITDIVPLLVYSFIPVLPPLMILWLPRGKTRNITGYIPAVFLIFLTEALP